MIFVSKESRMMPRGAAETIVRSFFCVGSNFFLPSENTPDEDKEISRVWNGNYNVSLRLGIAWEHSSFGQMWTTKIDKTLSICTVLVTVVYQAAAWSDDQCNPAPKQSFGTERGNSNAFFWNAKTCRLRLVDLSTEIKEESWIGMLGMKYSILFFTVDYYD